MRRDLVSEGKGAGHRLVLLVEVDVVVSDIAFAVRKELNEARV